MTKYLTADQVCTILQKTTHLTMATKELHSDTLLQDGEVSLALSISALKIAPQERKLIR